VEGENNGVGAGAVMQVVAEVMVMVMVVVLEEELIGGGKRENRRNLEEKNEEMDSSVRLWCLVVKKTSQTKIVSFHAPCLFEVCKGMRLAACLLAMWITP
jgi:hypothetical protein